MQKQQPQNKKRLSQSKGIFRGNFFLCVGVAFVAGLIAASKFTGFFMENSEKKLMICYWKMETFNKDSVSCKVEKEDITITKTNKQKIEKLYNEKWIYIQLSLIIFAIVFIFVLIVALKYAHKALLKAFEKDHIRGAEFLESDKLKLLLESEKKNSDITIGGVPIVKDTETTHFLIAGSTGQGKSVAIKEILDTARAKNQRAIIYDPSGEFTQEYCRKGKDIVMNPFDNRSKKWNVLTEISEVYDYVSIATSLIPQGKGDRFWTDGPREILKAILKKMKENNITSNAFLYRIGVLDTVKQVYDYVKGTPAASFIDPSNEKTSTAMRAVLAQYLMAWEYLDDKTIGDKEDYFSIKDFIKNEEDDRWLFIRCDMNMIDALRPLISLWIDIASKAILSMPINLDRRLWIILDELATLQQISIQDIMDKGRKYGVCAVLGFQSISQLEKNYGKEGATTLITCCKTWVMYNTPDSQTAKYLAQNIGQEDIIEKRENISLSNTIKNDSSSISEHYATRFVVMPEEIMYLEPLNAYLKLSGKYPATKIKLEWKKRDKISEAFEPKKQKK